MLILSNAPAVNASGISYVNVDTGKLNFGVVTVSCFRVNSDKKLKVLVEKDGKRVYYDLKNDGTEESFPLQFGNGVYTVGVLENTTGNNYRYITRKTVILELEDELSVYLASVQNVKWNSDSLCARIASELTDGLKSDTQKIKAIYNYVISNITYDREKSSTLETGYVPDIDRIIADKQGICYDFASVFAAMLRSQGIPAKLVKGYTPNAVGYHAWNEVYNPETGKWMVIDTTYDAKMRQLRGKYTMEKDASDYKAVNVY